MGSSPKKQEASQAERDSAAVAKAEYDYFKQKYDPLLMDMRDQSERQDVATTLRGRAGADTMQALTGQPSYQNTQNIERTGDLAQAYTGQLGVADASAKKIQNTAKTNVLGIARDQAADAQSGMAQASRLATSEALTRAKAKQQVANAKFGAIGQIAGATMQLGNKTGFFGDQSKGFGKFMDNFGTNLAYQQQGRRV